MTFERFVVRSSARWITVAPADPVVEHDKVLFFDRRCTGRPYSVRGRVECAALAEPDSERIVYGIVGVITLLVDTYLIVVDGRKDVGSILERRVYRATRLTAIPVRGTKLLKQDSSITDQQRKDESTMSSMLRAAIALPGFYFSHGIDLSRSAQKRHDMFATHRAISAAPDFARAELRFVWNRYVAKPLADAGIASWIVPLILGFVDVREGLVNGKAVQIALVSRRVADRPGLRYTARGADVNGHVSNFVETEQIVIHGDAFASYVQVRGSIPLLWQQQACFKYKPTPALKIVDAGGKDGLSQMGFEKHFASLFTTYGPVTAVSLVDLHGSEAVLANAMTTAVKHMNDSRLRYLHWDFHSKTKGSTFEIVDHDLIPAIDRDLGAYSYFLVADGNSSSPSMRQKGAVRVNCIDSLDRTNVVQCLIGHRIMDDALKQMGVLNNSPETCTASLFADFEKGFKSIWADHADGLSAVYSGTGALKTDYTRTGQRTKLGMAVDGFRSAGRYVYQNFLDGQRQDGLDLLLGVVSLEKIPIGKRSLDAVRANTEPLSTAEKFVPHAFGLCLACASISLIALPRKSHKALLFCLSLAGAGYLLKLMYANGRKYVARPILNGTH